MQNISFIGLGAMGTPMALNLLKKKCIIGIGRLPLNAKADGTEERPAISCEILDFRGKGMAIRGHLDIPR